MSLELADEAVRVTTELVRIDSTNYGDGSGPCEYEAAQYVLGLLREIGLEPDYLEPAPKRSSLVVRIPGADPTRPGLILHGHLDVVPADAADWSHDPFAGDVVDGVLYGRGAVDMKDMVGMMLANLRHLVTSAITPPRDIVFAFLADEEAGGVWGAEWIVRNRPELFADCSEAISEVGGYSITLQPADGGPATRSYLLQTAEKGYAWMRLRATGRAGHGSVPNDENAIVRLAEAIVRIDAYDWGIDLIAPVITLFDHVSEVTGVPWSRDDPAAFLPQLGGARQFVAGTLANTANLTTLLAGKKTNVIPGVAEASIDCRFLPGSDDKILATLRELAGGARRAHRRSHGPAARRAADRPARRRYRRGHRRRGPGRARRSVLPQRRHRQQVARRAGHPRVRVRAVAASRRPRLRAPVPRRRRARTPRRRPLRRACPAEDH